ncbi:MAG TPA: hypothetical protein VH597_02295 [Verrucomicrobiae bacterium]|jgi:hypothetical protein|nr:hypothetical protein [Verrucomicrobiae bacterium]
MNSFVIIFLPCGEVLRDVKAAFHNQVDLPDAVEKPAIAPTRTIKDAEQLPLWRWFISPK